jgi:hypothetical protein
MELKDSPGFRPPTQGQGTSNVVRAQGFQGISNLWTETRQ